MSIEMRPGSGFFYARIMTRGRRPAVPLDVRIAGNRPARISEQGDEEFERSRAAALAAERKLREELKDRSRQDADLKRRIQIRSGAKTASVALPDILPKWKDAGATKKRSSRYENQVEATWTRFEEFIAKEHPYVQEAIDVTPIIAAGFLAMEDARGLAHSEDRPFSEGSRRLLQ